MLRRLFPLLVVAAVALAVPFTKRQLNSVEQTISRLSVNVHSVAVPIITDIAMDRDNDVTVGRQISRLNNFLNQATRQLQNPALAPSGGPTDQNTADDVSTMEAQVISDIAQALGGLRTTDVPSTPAQVRTVDVALSNEINQFIKTIGGNGSLVHNLTVENSRIFGRLGMALTNQAIGQPATGAA